MLYLENLYTSNNICESINSKLNYYLPKRTTNNYDFIKSNGKVLLNNKILNNNINRKDYKAKSLIKLIEDKDFNENLEWINFNDFKKYIKLVINDKDGNIILTEQVKLDLLNKILDIEEEEIKIEDPINSINTILNNSIQNNFINDLMEETNSMDDSQNNVNDIYENKENSIEIDSVKKITNENFKCIENINTELENLSDNYDELNYLDNYDDLEVDKIVELFDYYKHLLF